MAKVSYTCPTLVLTKKILHSFFPHSHYWIETFFKVAKTFEGRKTQIGNFVFSCSHFAIINTYYKKLAYYRNLKKKGFVAH